MPFQPSLFPISQTVKPLSDDQTGSYNPNYNASAELYFSPVPDRIALGPDRVYLHLGTFVFGVQLSEDEAHRTIERLSGFRFDRLNQETVWNSIERFVGGVA